MIFHVLKVVRVPSSVIDASQVSQPIYEVISNIKSVRGPDSAIACLLGVNGGWRGFSLVVLRVLRTDCKCDYSEPLTGG